MAAEAGPAGVRVDALPVVAVDTDRLRPDSEVQQAEMTALHSVRCEVRPEERIGPAPWAACCGAERSGAGPVPRISGPALVGDPIGVA